LYFKLHPLMWTIYVSPHPRAGNFNHCGIVKRWRMIFVITLRIFKDVSCGLAQNRCVQMPMQRRMVSIAPDIPAPVGLHAISSIERPVSKQLVTL
jgi:hypothetical protein